WNFTVGSAGGSFDTADGEVSFFFPKNSVTEDTTITVTQVDPPPGTDFVAGSTYRFEPGMSFHQPVDLTISYDEAAITGDENDLRLGKFLEGGDPALGNQRQCVHSGVDTANDRVTGFITGFSILSTGVPNVPNPPNNISLEVNQDNSVTLRWPDMPGGPGVPAVPWVILERAERRAPGSMPVPPPSDGAFTVIAQRQTSMLSWTDHYPIGRPGIYFYRIRSLRGQWQSWPRWYDYVWIWDLTGPPAWQPGDTLSASAYPCGGVRLSWPSVMGDPQGTSGSASGYRVERRLVDPTQPPAVVIADLPYSDLSYVDASTALEPGREYIYSVNATNSAGESAPLSANVTVSSAEYFVALPTYYVRIAPGEKVTIEAEVKWLGSTVPYDVTLGATPDSSRLTASFFPSATTQDLVNLDLTVDPATPFGLTIEVEVSATGGVGGSLPTLTVNVVNPAAPVLDSLFPIVVAENDPGQDLTLEGSGFVQGSIIHIDGDPMTEVTYVDEKTLVASLPGLDPGTYKIKVVNPDGLESEELELSVVADSGLVLDSLDPEVIAADSGGEVVTLNGSGFVQGSIIHIDGNPWPEVEVVDETQIVASLPSLSPGTHKVKVVNPDDSESNELDLFAD
ncbi:MAG: IPT/TIG domain-containing protein, partial [Planctomycetota bacterium]